MIRNVIEQIIFLPYPVVVEIGCSEGYYAVRLGMQMCATRVLANDANPKVQENALLASLSMTPGTTTKRLPYGVPARLRLWMRQAVMRLKRGPE